MNGEEVRIRKQGAAVVLEPVVTDWAWLDAIEGKFSRDFFAEGRTQQAHQAGPPSMPPSSDAMSPVCTICSTQTRALRY